MRHGCRKFSHEQILLKDVIKECRNVQGPEDVAPKNWQSAKASDLVKSDLVVATKGLFNRQAKAGHSVEVTDAKAITLLKFRGCPTGLFSSVLKIKNGSRKSEMPEHPGFD